MYLEPVRTAEIGLTLDGEVARYEGTKDGRTKSGWSDTTRWSDSERMNSRALLRIVALSQGQVAWTVVCESQTLTTQVVSFDRREGTARRTSFLDSVWKMDTADSTPTLAFIQGNGIQCFFTSSSIKKCTAPSTWIQIIPRRRGLGKWLQLPVARTNEEGTYGIGK